jgi:hypothetical protein
VDLGGGDALRRAFNGVFGERYLGVDWRRAGLHVVRDGDER